MANKMFTQDEVSRLRAALSTPQIPAETISQAREAFNKAWGEAAESFSPNKSLAGMSAAAPIIWRAALSSVLTDETVERAARALFEARVGSDFHISWDEFARDVSVKPDRWRDDVRTVLAAAFEVTA